MPILVACWGSGKDRDVDPPDAVFRSNGRKADNQDVLDHADENHELVASANGFLDCLFQPSIVVDIRFDGYARLWFVVANGHEPVSLDLSDPEASDYQIVAALFELPTIFHAVIHR